MEAHKQGTSTTNNTNIVEVIILLTAASDMMLPGALALHTTAKGFIAYNAECNTCQVTESGC
jgi:hypothetical protein